MRANKQDRRKRKTDTAPHYVLPKRRSANAILVPLWTMLALLGANLGQPDNKKLIAALLTIGAAWAAVALALQHLWLAGRRTAPAKALGIVLILTLGCCWTSEYWLGEAPLLAIAETLAFGGAVAALILSIAISVMGMRVVKSDPMAERRG